MSNAIYPSLRGQLVVISGGASGIGEAMVEAFAEQGSRVAFLDVADDAAAALVERVAAAGHARPSFYHCDLTDLAALQRMVAELVDREGPVQVLVNNAANDVRHGIEDVTPQMWDGLMAVNLRHQFFVSQAVLPGMRAAKSGSIINFGSIAWRIPSARVPVYATAKAAIEGMTRALAHEVGADGVRVNAVVPGAILTERQRRLWMTPAYEAEVLGRQALKRHLLPAEVARLVLFLASDESSAITAQSFVVDGGWV